MMALNPLVLKKNTSYVFVIMTSFSLTIDVDLTVLPPKKPLAAVSNTRSLRSLYLGRLRLEAATLCELWSSYIPNSFIH